MDSKENKGLQLNFRDIVYKVQNKNYKKEIKKQKKDLKKLDIENSSDVINKLPIIEKDITILNSVNGEFKSGELVAILGPSGSGKTTLLDILAQRKSTGKISGQILINGKEIDQDYKNYCSYVTQEDILLETTSVFETIKFYADLKLPGYSEIEKVKRVEQVISDIGLINKTHCKIGGVLHGGIIIKGLSGGEKRRVSIGCGLVTNPKLLFLDEPTSGLDSSSSLLIMKMLLNLTINNGVTVISSIHQPRPEIFSLFNKVMVIIKGKSIYCGDNILGHFNSIGFECPNINPADFIIDTSVLLSESPNFNDICQKWEHPTNIEIMISKESKQEIQNKNFSTSWFYQYYILFNRTFKDYIRNKGNFISRIKTCTIVGLLFGACFANLKENDQDIQKILGTLFFLINALLLSPFALTPLFLSGRSLFNAERASKIYHSFPYYLAYISVELIIEFISSFILISITYMISTLRWDANHFFFAVMVLFFVHVIGNFIVLTFANLTSKADLTFSYTTATCAIFLLFAGFYVPTNQLPISFSWLHWINPIFFSFSALIINQFENLPIQCVSSYDTNKIKEIPKELLDSINVKSISICPFDNGNEIINYLGLEIWSKGELFSIVLCWTLFFFTTSYLALHFLHKEKR